MFIPRCYIHLRWHYLNLRQNYSLRMRKLLTLLCLWFLSQRAKALKMCQSVVNKCHKYLMNIFFDWDSLCLQHFWDLFNDLRTFPANLFVTKKQTPQTFLLLERMIKSHWHVCPSSSIYPFVNARHALPKYLDEPGRPVWDLSQLDSFGYTYIYKISTTCVKLMVEVFKNLTAHRFRGRNQHHP